MIYVLDRAAAAQVLEHAERVRQRGIVIEDLSGDGAKIRVGDLKFFRDPATGQLN